MTCEDDLVFGLLANQQTYPPGIGAGLLQIGDFILCHRKGIIPACIRLGQRLRFRGEDRRYAYWSHAALVVSPEGDLVEALSKGVERSHISKYKTVEYTVARPILPLIDQRQILRFADHVVGERYAWATIACIAFGMLTGGRLTFGFAGQTICSGLVARAQERAGAVFDREPQEITPADLARYYNVSRSPS